MTSKISRLRAADLRSRSGLAHVRVYARLRSTNTRASELIERGDLCAPAAVVASLQTAGRGRGRNAWHADTGSLTATFIFPVSPHRPATELPLRAGLAALHAAARFVDVQRLQVKWPNDLLADGKKLAGILCERVRGVDLVGIGFNITTNLADASPDVRRYATTLAKLTRRPPTRGEFFAVLAKCLAEVWELEDWQGAFNQAHALNGKTIGVDTGDATVRGRCEGIDAQGRLLVHDGRKLHRLINGTIIL